MSVSIHDMQSFAESMASPEISISNDIGNIIQLGGNEVDDLGMDLLANTNISASRSSQPSGNSGISSDYGNTINVSTSRPVNDISVGALEPLEAVSFDIPSGDSSSGPAFPEIQVNKSSSDGGGMFGDNSQTATGPGISLASPLQRKSPEEERKEKADLITKLARLESKGFQVQKRFTMDNSLDEIKTEYDRLMDARNLEQSIKFQRQMMMGFVTGVEMMNAKFNPFDWQLDGWSESVHENVDDFDEVFEELYDKYKSKGSMPPEAKLLFSLAGSGFMFHMSNSFFRSKMSNISADDILRNNPALAKQFAAAAAQAAGPGFGNFMGMTMGVPPQGGSAPAPASAAAEQHAPMPPQNMFFNAPNAPPAAMNAPSPAQRREMKGPSGVDDILKTFAEVRDAELSGMGAPVFVQPAPPPAPGGNSFNARPSAQALAELQSLHSEEAMSHAESTRTGRTAGGRRRKAQVPVGNTFQLNV